MKKGERERESSTLKMKKQKKQILNSLMSSTLFRVLNWGISMKIVIFALFLLYFYFYYSCTLSIH